MKNKYKELFHRIGGTEESIRGKKPCWIVQWKFSTSHREEVFGYTIEDAIIEWKNNKNEDSPVRDIRFITEIKKQERVV